jgi:hypothetical protein
MIIGLDLDGTISELPELFSLLSQALVEAGHEVHVITFRDPRSEDEVRVELAEHGIRYTGLHLPAMDVSSMEEWKGTLAAELGLDAMFEDSPEVLAAMPPGVKRVWICDPEWHDLRSCIRGMLEGGGR